MAIDENIENNHYFSPVMKKEQPGYNEPNDQIRSVEIMDDCRLTQTTLSLILMIKRKRKMNQC
jgi:hypothetical protein